MSRTYFPRTGQADRIINRPGEKWADVASRVAHGNRLLHPESGDLEEMAPHLSPAS